MDKILQTILEHLKKDTRKQGEFLEYLDLSSSTVSDWKTGKSSSYLKYLPLIAEYFSVTVDMMINGYTDSYKEAPAPCKIPVVQSIPKSGACVTADNIVRYDCACVRFSNEYFFFEEADTETVYLIHRQNYADPGDTVLLKTDLGGTVSKYKKGGSVAVFVSDGEQGDVFTADEDRLSEFIAGVAAEVRRKLN